MNGKMPREGVIFGLLAVWTTLLNRRMHLFSTGSFNPRSTCLGGQFMCVSMGERFMSLSHLALFHTLSNVEEKRPF